MKILRSTFYIMISAVVGVLFSCMKEPLTADSVSPASWELSVPWLTATANDSGFVDLSWGATASAVNFYSIYRTAKVDTFGNPDTLSLSSTEFRAIIDPSLTKFADVPELNEGAYFYAIRAGKVDGIDTVRGKLCWASICTVGALVRLKIADGEDFTATNSITIEVADPRNRLVSCRLTQSFHTDSITSAGVHITLPPDTSGNAILNDKFNQIRDLRKSGFIQNSTTVSVNRVTVPVFDTMSMPVGQAFNQRSWILPGGIGKKIVFAEVTYRNGSVDTLFDEISTTPHPIEIIFRNKPGFAPDASMKDTSEFKGAEAGTLPIKIFYGDTLQFSIKTYSDPTLNVEFDCWLMFSSIATIDGKTFTTGTNNWIMTPPVKFALTGAGDLHDPDFRYSFLLDSANLGVRDTVLARCIRGTLLKVKDSVFSAKQNLDSINFLKPDAYETNGKKQFLFVVRFKERNFNDSIVTVYGFSGPDLQIGVARDRYLPIVKFNNSNSNPDYLGEGSIITTPFNFALDTSSFFDNGYANIRNISLLIARKPASLNWVKGTTFKTLDVEQLRLYRNAEIEWPVENPNWQQKYVRWDNIDPRDWPSGSYIVGVVVKDQYGQEGFARPWIKTDLPNPWLVEIKTSN